MNTHTLIRKQFDILTFLERSSEVKSQRDIAEATAMSVGSVNRGIAALAEQGLLSDNKLTEKGYAALEP